MPLTNIRSCRPGNPIYNELNGVFASLNDIRYGGNLAFLRIPQANHLAVANQHPCQPNHYLILEQDDNDRLLSALLRLGIQYYLVSRSNADLHSEARSIEQFDNYYNGNYVPAVDLVGTEREPCSAGQNSCNTRLENFLEVRNCGAFGGDTPIRYVAPYPTKGRKMIELKISGRNPKKALNRKYINAKYRKWGRSVTSKIRKFV